MNVACRLKDFRVREDSSVNLKKWPTQIKPLYRSKAEYREKLEEYRADIRDLQTVLYAHDRYSLLLIFQGMDTAGKDGAIRHVMSGIDPQGCQVYSFKQPSSEELDHDFLWRTNKCLPERGRIGIFNRSYYEEVLVVRVFPEILQKQRLPKEALASKSLWRERFDDIVNLEDYLFRNGTRVVKFFLHLSKQEQRRRLLARIDDPNKNWKLSPADIEMRRYWNPFQAAYEDCLRATSRRRAPWYVIPADDKRNARLIISKIIVDTMKDFDMDFPKPAKTHKKDLQTMRRQLAYPSKG